MTNRYEIDTDLRLSVTFTLVSSNSPVDPAAVTLWVRPPTGTVTHYTLADAQIVRDAAGVYHCDLRPDQAGRWIYKWQGEGAVDVTTPDVGFVVNRTVFFAAAP